jgi:cytochrome d ubiquinol oxidase subunit II
MGIPLDYEMLRLIWWLFLGVLLIGFAIMDGFDLGVAILLPFVARTDIERRVTINTIGPFWDGNQVWLILGGGAVFAAWPPVYAASFSGFYLAMFLVLATLILRPVGFDFRNKIPDPRWRAFWDYALFAGGLVPSVVFGVAFGNLLQGVPFSLDSDLRILYTGSGLFELLNPFGLLCGLVSSAMLAGHGAIYLTLKTEGTVQARARGAALILAPATIVLFALAGLWVAWGIDGYVITSPIAADGPSNPLLKTVTRQPGQWFANYRAPPARPFACFAVHVGAPVGPGFYRKRAWHFRHHRHRWGEHVSVPHAIEHRTGDEPDRLGCLVEPAHAVCHVASDTGLPPHRADLHFDRVPGAARRGNGEPRGKEFVHPLLRTQAMWYFTWILGVGFACGCGILNALWHEHYLPDEQIDTES